MKKIQLSIFFIVITTLTFGFPSSTFAYNLPDPLTIFDSEFDAAVISLMETNHIPSCTFSAVYKNETYYAKGYGINPSVDRPNYWMSPGKTTTAVAILQLQEQGLLYIDDDINDYLPYELRNPRYPDTPITIKHILAHRSGMRETLDQLYMVLNGTLNFPTFIYELYHVNGSHYDSNNWANWEPGARMGASDFAPNVAAFIVNNVTGVTFYEYVQTNIFDPLGMANTTADLSHYPMGLLDYSYGWDTLTEELIQYGFLNVSSIPGSGGFLTTVNDMAKFLLMNMNQGTLNGAQILNETSAQIMHTEIKGSKKGLFWNLRIEVNGINGLQGGIGGSFWGSKTYMLFRGDIGVNLLINQEHYQHENLFAFIYRSMSKGVNTEESNFSSIPIYFSLSILTTLFLFRRKRNIQI